MDGSIDCYACEKALCGDLADGLDYKNMVFVTLLSWHPQGLFPALA